MMNIYCLCNHKKVNFDSITKSKCWGQSMAVLHATLGLNERDKEEEDMEIERQTDTGLEEIGQGGKCGRHL